jgi:hypothetical protein
MQTLDLSSRWLNPDVDVINIVRKCIHCNEETLITLDNDRFKAWQVDREFVQNVWPEATTDDREMLISGTHPKCWEEMWADDDDN